MIAEKVNGVERICEDILSKMKFPFLSAAQVLARQSPKPLIEGLLGLGELAYLVGDAGVHKTRLALAMSLSVSTGTPFLGRKVEKGLVVYVAAEGQEYLADRLYAWKEYHRITHTNKIIFLYEPVNVTDGEAVGDFIEDLKTVTLELNQAINLVVIDTLNASLAGAKEDDEGIGKYNCFTRTIKQATGAAVLTIHHTGWNSKRVRGHSSLHGAVDVGMLLKLALKKENADLVLSCPKSRNTTPFTPIRLNVQDVKLKDGSTNCVLTEAGEQASEVVEKDQERTPKGKVPMELVALVKKLIDKQGEFEGTADELLKRLNASINPLVDHWALDRLDKSNAASLGKKLKPYDDPNWKQAGLHIEALPKSGDRIKMIRKLDSSS